MRILNSIELSLLKVVLKKFYLSSNLDYLFLEPGESLLDAVRLNKPDILVLEVPLDKGKARAMLENLVVGGIGKSVERILVVRENRTDQTVARNILSVSHADLLEKLSETILEISRSTQEQREVMTQLEQQRIILYADDDPFMHQVAADAFAGTEYTLIHAHNGEHGLALFQMHHPSLVITDLDMPGLMGDELCRLIKGDAYGAQVPVIILTGSQQPGSEEIAFNYGADDFLQKPLRPEALVNRVNEYFVNRSQKREERILVVDDSRMIREIVRHAIVKHGMTALTAEDGLEALEMIRRDPPDILITDINMPRMDGYELVKTLREDPELKDLKVLMISSNSAPYDIRRGNALGIIKYFVKPFDVDKLIMEVEHILLQDYKLYKAEYGLMLEAIRSLIQALEERDPYTRGHTDRVTALSVRLATHLGLDAKEVERIRIAANLHDIGKIGIRDDVLLKSEVLTAEEYVRIQEHTIKGVEILKPITTLQEVLPLILLHHERWDGQGYPTYVSGEDIPMGARIISVADAFDAMTTDRPYHDRITKEEALENIREDIGTQFCPICAGAFIEMMRKES